MKYADKLFKCKVESCVYDEDMLHLYWHRIVY